MTELSSRAPLRATLVLEQTLGHVTHSANSRSLLADERQLDPTFLPIRPEVDGFARRIPGFTLNDAREMVELLRDLACHGKRA